MFRRTILTGGVLILAVVLVAMPSPVVAQRVRVAKTRQNVELHLADDVVVRWEHAPRQFDSQRNPVKPTAE